MPFEYKGWKAEDAIDALMAYDHGATDSGVNDWDMKEALKKYIQEGPDEEVDELLCDFMIKHCVGPEARKAGYGFEDAHSFLVWLTVELGIDF